MRGCRGFTLAELLLVILIMMILMGMLLVTGGKSRNAVYYNQTLGTIRDLYVGIESYKVSNGRYPAPEYKTGSDANCPNITTGSYTTAKYAPPASPSSHWPLLKPTSDPDKSLAPYYKPDPRSILGVYLSDGWGTPFVYTYTKDPTSTGTTDSKFNVIKGNVHPTIFIYSYGMDAAQTYTTASYNGDWPTTPSLDNKSVSTNVNADNVYLRKDQ